MHSINKCNFAILHCFGKEFKPRFTNLNNELKNICGSSDLEKYSKYKINYIIQKNGKATYDFIYFFRWLNLVLEVDLNYNFHNNIGIRY